MMTPSCLKAMAGQMETPIYYPDYWELEEQAVAMLQDLMGAREEILFLACSTTFGEEAAICSLLALGDKVVVLNGGVFGQVAVDLQYSHRYHGRKCAAPLRVSCCNRSMRRVCVLSAIVLIREPALTQLERCWKLQSWLGARRSKFAGETGNG